MFVGFPTLEHATYSCPCEKHGSQCCHAFRETSPRREETGCEGRRMYHTNTGASDTDKHVTLRVGSTVLSCLSQNISQEGRNRLRRSKNVSYKHWGFRHRHTRDSQGWQHCVVMPFAKHLAEGKKQVEKVEEGFI